MAGEPLPALSPRAWELLLSDRLAAAGEPTPRFRLIRSEGRRAIAEVDHLSAARVRAAWAASASGATAPTLIPYRTWGTLVGAKKWLRGRRAPARE
ncbi:MAG TPA: hypothetical protein VEG66_01225 [Thermoplasmata archaeon]|nr:hypothetical protein [Thermoplasmata archaeon]